MEDLQKVDRKCEKRIMMITAEAYHKKKTAFNYKWKTLKKVYRKTEKRKFNYNYRGLPLKKKQ